MDQIITAPREGRRTTEKDPAKFLHPTYYLDFDHPLVRDFAADRTRGARDERERAVRLFYAVRDEIRYNPYSLRIGPEHYRASCTLERKTGWCVPKGVLMAAACRASGLAARLGYADVRNHLATKRLLDLMGSDLFTWHGYVELWLDGRWIKTTPVFDRTLCERFHVVPQEFDGTKDTLFQQFDALGRRHMEYVTDHGVYDDLPYSVILADFDQRYPRFMAGQRAGQAGDFASEAAPA
jgi:transglutaminase-like putative cysteine protease